jgi:hypothetical protein
MGSEPSAGLVVAPTGCLQTLRCLLIAIVGLIVESTCRMWVLVRLNPATRASSSRYGRMARADHGPIMPYPSTPCERATPEKPDARFTGGPPIRLEACGRLLSLWTPYAVRLCIQGELEMTSRIQILFQYYTSLLTKEKYEAVSSDYKVR